MQPVHMREQPTIAIVRSMVEEENARAAGETPLRKAG